MEGGGWLAGLRRVALRRPAWQRWAACLACTAGITVLSLLPGRDVPFPPLIPNGDKVGHLIAYGVYAALLVWALPVRPSSRVLFVAGIVVYCALYGLAMEALQATLQPGDRVCSLADAVANTTGALLCGPAALAAGFTGSPGSRGHREGTHETVRTG